MPLSVDLLKNPDVIHYLNYSSNANKSEIILKALTQITEIKNTSEYIHSIYLYNTKLGYISNLNGYEGLNMISDRNLSFYLASLSTSRSFLMKRTSTFNEKDDILGNFESVKRDLYTIVFKDIVQNNALILNLSEDSIRKKLASYNTQNDDKNFYIIDGENKFISSPNSFQFGMSALEYDSFSTILKEPVSRGYKKIYDSNKIPYFCCWVDQPEMNWRLIYLIPYNRITETYKALKSQIFFIMFLLLSITLTILGLISIKMEKRLNFEKKITSFLLNNDVIPHELEKNDILFATGIFRLDSDSINIFSVEQLLSVIRIRTSNNYYMIHITNNLFFIISKKSSKELKMIISNISKLLKNKNIILSGIISAKQFVAEDIPSEMMELQNILAIKYLTQNNFLEYSNKKYLDIPNNKNINLSKIHESLRTLKVEDYKKEINIIIENLRDIQNIELLKSACVSIATEILSIFRQPLDEYYINGAKAFFSRMIENEQIQDIKNTLLDIVPVIEEENRQKGNIRGGEIIEKIKVYLENHLCDKMLNSSMVAESFHLSLNYTRVIFKKYTNYSINEYIGKLRIEKAQLLLIETNDSINEIKDKVGFGNYSYFCTYFKNNCKLSPSQYRLYNSKSK